MTVAIVHLAGRTGRGGPGVGSSEEDEAASRCRRGQQQGSAQGVWIVQDGLPFNRKAIEQNADVSLSPRTYRVGVRPHDTKQQ